MNKKNAFPVILKNVNDIIPFDDNTRVHTQNQIKQVARSIEQFGFNGTLTIDENNVLLSGHCRLMAAKLIGIEELPCTIRAGLTDIEKRAYVIADNKHSDNSSFDERRVKDEMIKLHEAGFDLTMTGFSMGEIAGLNLDGDNDFQAGSSSTEKTEFETVRFTLHHEQTPIVEEAIASARALVIDEGINENAKGNALAMICREWLDLKAGAK